MANPNAFDTSWLLNNSSANASSPMQMEDFETSSFWYSDTNSQQQPTESGQNGIFGDIWDWAKTEQGTAVLGGAIQGAGSVWAAGKKSDSAEDLLRLRASLEADLARLKDQLEGPSEAELKDARISRHNRSINLPMNLSVR